MVTFGFIGTGNMGGALARAARKRLPGEEILLANRNPDKAKSLSEELQCNTGSNEDAAREAQYLFLGVKPQGLPPLLSELSPLLRSRKEPALLISMAAGTSIFRIK